MTSRPILFSGPMVRALLDGRKTQTRRVIKGVYQPPPGSGCAGFDCIRDLDGGPSRLDIAPRNWELCPYGQPGDTLWVRETWGLLKNEHPTPGDSLSPFLPAVPFRDHAPEVQAYWLKRITHHATDNVTDRVDLVQERWRPSIHMPRWVSRLSLEVTEVRVERVADISEEDAKAEGVRLEHHEEPEHHHAWAVTKFRELWDSINAAPRPIKVDGVIDHYVSYPFDGKSETREHRGKPWIVTANPRVWCVTFKRLDEHRGQP